MPLAETELFEDAVAVAGTEIDIAGDMERGVTWVRVMGESWMDSEFPGLEEETMQ